MEVGVLTGLILLVMMTGFVLLIVALVDLVKRSPQAWEQSGHNQLVWALIVIFIGFIGPVLYLVIARPALEGRARIEGIPASSR